MNTPLLQCPKCRAWLLEGVFNRPDPAPCPSCGTAIRVELFPAFFRQLGPGNVGEAVMVEGESSCFYHPQKKAVQPCQACGRFLCALCDCEFQGQHFCPACLETGRTKGKIKSLENQRTLYDSIALAVAILGFCVSFVTAPIAVYIALRYWNKPLSPARRTKARFIAALIIAGLQIAGWILYFVSVSNRR